MLQSLDKNQCACTVPGKAVPADSHEVSTWCSWQRSQVHLFSLRYVKPGKNGGKMEVCRDTLKKQKFWHVAVAMDMDDISGLQQEKVREKETNRRREWLLCVNCWSLPTFILSVAAVKLLRVSVVVRNCCEIHPLAPNPLPKLYTSIFNRFWVYKSELATLWQAVLWRETSALDGDSCLLC